MRIQLDGFIRVAGNEKLNSAHNVEMYRNQFSPFSNAHQLRPASIKTLLIDKYYGYVFDEFSRSPVGLYGQSSMLPTYPIDLIGNYGVLRVPLRKVPRRVVRSRSEPQAIIERLDRDTPDEKRFVFRGQRREYQVPRSRETREALYGDPDALEPALLPSASRRNRSVDAVIGDWAYLVQFFMLRYVESARKWASERTMTDICSGHERAKSSPHFLAFAKGLAQHYGMPTFGLDVTSRLDIAIWFALHDFKELEEGGFAVVRPDRDAETLPVIYLFDVHPFQGFPYSNVRPVGWPPGRPDRQSAWFMPTGWGFRLNRPATYLVAAFYLDPSRDFGPQPQPIELFPGAEQDPFAEFLETVLAASDGDLKELMKDFRWVV